MEGWVDLGYPAMHWPGVELMTSQSQVRHPNHYTTEPPTELGVWHQHCIPTLNITWLSILALEAWKVQTDGQMGCSAYWASYSEYYNNINWSCDKRLLVNEWPCLIYTVSKLTCCSDLAKGSVKSTVWATVCGRFTTTTDLLTQSYCSSAHAVTVYLPGISRRQ